MTNLAKFKVGDLVVRFGKILKISTIMAASIKLRPFFDLQSNHGITYSIPSQNFDNGHIRHLVSQESLPQLLKLNLTPSSKTVIINVTETKSALSTHELSESLELIKTLWLEKQNHAGFLPGGRLNLYQQALTQASEEIAAIKGILPEAAKILVLNTLKKSQKSPSLVS